MQMFRAEHFVPTKWDTAEDKAWFANQFVKFVGSGFSENYFTKRFYDRLNGCFGHIAHYDLHGFWNHFFESQEGKVQFLKQCMTHTCVGDPEWTYSDVERKLVEWLKANDAWAKAVADRRAEVEKRERAELKRLKAKYE
jgi:hypothetical protein